MANISLRGREPRAPELGIVAGLPGAPVRVEQSGGTLRKVNDVRADPPVLYLGPFDDTDRADTRQRR